MEATKIDTGTLIYGYIEFIHITNDAPVITNAATNQTAVIGMGSFDTKNNILGSPVFVYDISNMFSDPDSDPITIQAYEHPAPTAIPVWVAFDGSIFTIDPRVELYDKKIVVQATDGKGNLFCTKLTLLCYRRGG